MLQIDSMADYIVNTFIFLFLRNPVVFNAFFTIQTYNKRNSLNDTENCQNHSSFKREKLN